MTLPPPPPPPPSRARKLWAVIDGWGTLGNAFWATGTFIFLATHHHP